MTQLQAVSFDGTTLSRGDRFTATTTGVLRGRRIFTTRLYVAARDQEVERDFVPARADTPAQGRVFVEHPHGSVPTLVVQGSIRPVGGAR